MSLKKRVLITGGAIRLGKAIALSLAEANWDIAIHYGSSETEAHQTAEEIRELGSACQIIKADLSQEAEVLALIPNTIDNCGALNLLINCASTFQASTISETTPALLRAE